MFIGDDGDDKYSRICRYVENDWPRFHLLDDMSQHFHKFRSELHVENGLFLLYQKLVIPEKLQSKMVKRLHGPHLGIEKSLARVRELYYWPETSSRIREVVQSCIVCERFRRNNQKKPLMQEESLKYPFHIVAMDLFEYAG